MKVIMRLLLCSMVLGCGESKEVLQPDTIKPAKPQNLQASDAVDRTGSLLLTCTIPGDDIWSGAAAEYDLRYATSPITLDNWESARRVPTPPPRLPEFGIDSLRVHGLSPDSTYYFALRAGDESGNWCDLSSQNTLRTTLADAHWWHGFGTGYRPGFGMGNYVLALTVYEGDLIAGGNFDWAGGTEVNHLARWDGTGWRPLGEGVDGQVAALTVYNGELIAAGAFQSAGNAPAGGIAAWNGTSWRSLAGGVSGGTSGHPRVAAMTVYRNSLIVGGNFTWAGGATARHIARWDGSTWLGLGSGITGSSRGVNALGVYEGELIVAGEFWEIGDLAARGAARWNEDSWLPIWPGLENGTAESILADRGKLYLGRHVWDGTQWETIGNWNPFALTVFNDDVVAGGYFTGSGFIARWNGSEWLPMGSGVTLDAPTSSPVLATAVWRGNLYVGGSFRSAGGKPSAHIARWDE